MIFRFIRGPNSNWGYNHYITGGTISDWQLKSTSMSTIYFNYPAKTHHIHPIFRMAWTLNALNSASFWSSPANPPYGS